ncbi:hypothetical protein C8J27_106204 [Rhodobacter aestuarii]|uniref:Uncharacterized protein n=2 Tax=Rhodobacter aestuarii TaxID=453582 RepID=A0A1N7M9E8_9RHOB|nr:hypothetical protein C8J27_106204 [Rhodobacter aestuarii]SIS82697.1 hypothetical protein SAMN05421580_105204 [Rhodobacter aestuarii]
MMGLMGLGGLGLVSIGGGLVAARPSYRVGDLQPCLVLDFRNAVYVADETWWYPSYTSGDDPPCLVLDFARETYLADVDWWKEPPFLPATPVLILDFSNERYAA